MVLHDGAPRRRGFPRVGFARRAAPGQESVDLRGFVLARNPEPHRDGRTRRRSIDQVVVRAEPLPGTPATRRGLRPRPASARAAPTGHRRRCAAHGRLVAPRHQALQRDGHPERARGAGRFRVGNGTHSRFDPLDRGPCDRDSRVHVARAGGARSGRARKRLVQRRRPLVRGVDRTAAVRRSRRRDPRDEAATPADPAVRAGIRSRGPGRALHGLASDAS